MEQAGEGQILGKPTLLVRFGNKLDAQQVLGALGPAGYPAGDVSVYWRLQGTDQVLDASTGEIAAGQALNAAELKKQEAAQYETLVLMHPDAAQFAAAQGALNTLGQADFMYAGDTVADAAPGGAVRHDETPEEKITEYK